MIFAARFRYVHAARTAADDWIRALHFSLMIAARMISLGLDFYLRTCLTDGAGYFRDARHFT